MMQWCKCALIADAGSDSPGSEEVNAIMLTEHRRHLYIFSSCF